MKKFLLTLITLFLVTTAACANGAAMGAEMKIKIDITSDSGKHVLTATLVDNSSAKAFYAELQKNPITVQMHDYGNFEKVGSLPKSFPRNDTQITTSAGEIILYQGNQITIYYDVNSWNFTQLGKVVSTGSTTPVSQEELKKILGKGNVTAVFNIEK